MWIANHTIAAGRNATTSSTPFHGPPFARRKSPSPISCAIPIASTATSTATGGAASHASTAVRPVPITAWSSHPPHGDGVVLFSFIVPPSPRGQRPSAPGDNTGQMYRRNRYYDPVTGRFTQEDPLGLAGGLNLYGFAAGDPVNFSDPFGLCPEKMRDKDGRCPGGLTVEQWRRVEYAANNRMQKEARDRVLKLLREGR